MCHVKPGVRVRRVPNQATHIEHIEHATHVEHATHINQSCRVRDVSYSKSVLC